MLFEFVDTKQPNMCISMQADRDFLSYSYISEITDRAVLHSYS